MQLALECHGNTVKDSSFKPHEFFSQNFVRTYRTGVGAEAYKGVTCISNDSLKACFGAQLSRGSSFTGADLLQNDIIAEFDFNGNDLKAASGVVTTPQDMYIRSWIAHDRILTINRSGITVKY